jgi:hypothetical protein
MRPIERKILQQISESGVSFEQVQEWVEMTSTPEMKKSFPDDCHFQTSRYFAKTILDSLLRQKFIFKDGNRYYLPKKNKAESTTS